MVDPTDAMNDTQRPEMALFYAMGIARGWKTEEKEDETYEVRFEVELGNDDACILWMQHDVFMDGDRIAGGLSAGVYLYPEGDPLPASPDAQAARIAGWLRTLADQLCPDLGEPA